MGVLVDHQIRSYVNITPKFDEGKVPGKLSRGISHMGYDLTLAPHFKVFTPTHCAIVDPHDFDTRAFTVIDADEVLIPPNSFLLAMSIEIVEVPHDCIAMVFNKSSLARCGIACPATLLEPCLSEDSEALTSTGWVPMAHVSVGDLLLTRRSDGIAEYQPVERKQERDYNGPMLHFDGRSVNQLVTPDHKLLVWKNSQKDYNRTPQLSLVAASEVFDKHNYSFDRKVSWLGASPETITIGSKTYPALPFLDFYGCWLGDGSAYKSTSGDYMVKLAVVTKEQKRIHFRAILEKLGINAREHDRGFAFGSKDLCLWLRQFGHAKEKFIDRDIMMMSPGHLNSLLCGLIASDGNEETQTYTTLSRKLADDVQEVAFKTGRSAIVRTLEDEPVFGNLRTVYKIRVCEKHMTPYMPPDAHEEIAYRGSVYDVTVPNHVFFCRRNGKASWTGNCWKGAVTLEFANHSPLPARLRAYEGCCQVVFLRCDDPSRPCEHAYDGRYQNQTGITLPFVTEK